MIYKNMKFIVKVHLTPEIFFAQTNPLTVWIISSEKFFDLVKTSNFYDLLNLTKIGSSGLGRVEL